MNQPRNLFLASLLATALFAGCSSDNSSSSFASTNGSSTTMAVTPSLGKIYNAAIEARCAATGTTLGSGTTGSTGLISLTLVGTCSGPVIVELFASASSTYFDEQANADIPMPAGTQLRALLPSLPTGPVNVAVTPLTEIAFQQALADAGNSESAITTAQANAANSAVATQVFGAAAAGLDILEPPTLWDSSTTAGSLGNSNADRYAYFLAALAGMGAGSATPALAVTNALASDLADDVLDGFSNSEVTYTSGDFASQLESALAGFSAYATAELKTALGIDEDGEEPGENSFPNETITLTPKNKNVNKDDLADTGIVGTFTGNKGETTINGNKTSVDNCSVTVTANGEITVSAGAESLTQTIDGGIDDKIWAHLQPNSWGLSAGSGDSAEASLNIYRHKMASAYAQTTTADKVIRCWMPINRVKTSAAADWNNDYQYGSATANNFSSAIVGTYSGELLSASGVIEPEGSTCTVTVGADGKMELKTGGAATTPITRTASIAGDKLDTVLFNSDDNWRLQAHDLNDPASNGFVSVELFRVTASAMTATLVVDSATNIWGCRNMSKDGAEEPGENSFPNEIITLPIVSTTLLPAADIAGAVGTFTGTTGLIKEGGNTTTVDSCSITVAANGDVTVSAGSESITQTIDGGNGDASTVSLSNTDTWTLSVGGAPGYNVPWANLNIDRNKMIDGHAYIVADTSAIPTVFTKEVKCWMPINRIQTTADSDWNSRLSSATAQDFPAVIAGTYTGTLFSDNGTLAPAGSTCTLLVGTDGSLGLTTGGTVSTPVSLTAQIGGDDYDRVSFTDDLNWTLRGRDISDPVGTAHVTVSLQNVNGAFQVTGGRKLANENPATGWACLSMTKEAP